MMYKIVRYYNLILLRVWTIENSACHWSVSYDK